MPKTTKQKIKVFVDAEVICLDHFSGIGHYTAALLKQVDKQLDKKEFGHITVTLGVPRRMRNRIDRFGFKNFRVRSMPTSMRVANGLKTRGLLPPIDLLFGNQTYVFPNYSSWPVMRSPCIPIIYDLSFVLHPEFAEDQNRRFLVKQAQLSAERATRVITISTNSQEEICEHYKLDKQQVDILYPITDKENFYRRSPNEIKDVMARYGVLDKYILFVGNIEPRKNLISLLKAYALLDQTKVRDYTLLLVGAKGWKDGEIHALMNELQDKGLNVLQPTSYVTDEDMPALISGATVFTYVSRYEGFGIPPVEAMFCGTPVISSDNSSLPEAVGQGALMVDAEDTAQIRDAIQSLLLSPELRTAYVKKGYQHIKKAMFVPESVGREFMTTIEKANQKEG